MTQAAKHGSSFVVETDGPRGRDGSREPMASSGGGSGADGLGGRSATAPSIGIGAGEVRIVLDGVANTVRVQGLARHLGATNQLDESTPIADIDVVQVYARGGDGGDGGHGGHGGHGAQGRRGSNATRYSSGGRGGRGGQGGDGGKGTHGATAGDGGHIRISVPEDDTYLLMLVDGAEDPAPRVAPGKGGDVGQHGRGGTGGPGGRGGASYSWTEHHTRTNSDGNSESYTTFHSNPGGSTGPRGGDGYSPQSTLRYGRNGTPGTFTISVHDKDGGGKGREFSSDRLTVAEYPRRFDLELQAFEIDEPDDLDNDGILEFGERVRTRDFKFENIGGMPTPSPQRVRVNLGRGELIRPRAEEAFIDRSLAADENTVVLDPLHFDIHDPEITEPADPLVWREEILPQAWQLGNETGTSPDFDSPFRRRFRNVIFGRTIAARFPLRNTIGTNVLRSLAPGEGTRLEFVVENISRISLGADSDRNRRVRLQLWLDPNAQVRPDQVAFVDENGARFQFSAVGTEFASTSNDSEGAKVTSAGPRGDDDERSGWVCEVPLIHAQSEARVRGSIWIAEDVSSWSAVTFRMSLLLDRLDREQKKRPQLRCVQQRDFTIRAEAGYDWNANNRVLLVAHDGVEREAWRAWHRVLEEDLGLGCDDWSLSRYGHIDFDADPGDGTSLRAHLEDRLVIVLNHPFHPTGDETTHLPTDYLQGKDFRTSAVAEGTRALVVGEPRFELEEWLAPVRDVRASGDDAPSVRSLLRKERTTADRIVQEEFREDPTIRWDTAQVSALTFFFFKPDDDALRKRTRKLLKKLEEIHPGRRYVIVEKPVEELTRDGRSWWFGLPRWNLGSVEVRRTLDDDRAFSIVHPASLEEASSATFIEAKDNRFAISLALPFEEKLAALDRVLNRGDINGDLDDRALATARALVRAILIDVLEEQTALRNRRARLSKDVLAKNLVALERLVAFPLRRPFAKSSNRWEPLVDLCAGLHAFVDAQRRWWRVMGRRRKLSNHTQDRLTALEMHWFNAGVVDETGNISMDSDSARARIAERTAPLVESILVLREQIPVGFVEPLNDDAAGFFFRQYLTQAEVVRDMDLFQAKDARIWTESDLLRAQAREQHREQAQAKLRAQNMAERAALLLSPAALHAPPSNAATDGTAATSVSVVEESTVSA